MLGWIDWEESGRDLRLEEVALGGARVARLRLGTGGSGAARRVRRGAALLRGAGVRWVALAPGCPGEAYFWRAGLRAVDPGPLRRRLAARVVLRGLERAGIPPRQTLAAVCADRVTAPVEATVRELALGCRYVALDAGGGGGALSRRLGAEMGAALLLEPGRAALEEAHALVLFSPRGDLTGANPVFCPLYPGARSLWTPRLPSETGLGPLPPVVGEQLAAALVYTGALDEEKLFIEIDC